MLVLVTYDVSTKTASGRARLRKIARECTNYGQRVQNSTFECVIDFAKWTSLKKKLVEMIDYSEDSLRFYYLGNNYGEKKEHYGVKQGYDAESFLAI